MNPILRNILAVVAGLVIGGFVNSSIIKYGINLFPAPDGVNPMDIDSIKSNIDKYELRHFITPFLAHALGTLVGAFVTVKIAASRQFKLASIIAGLFLIGGIMMAYMIPEFWKYSIVDLIFAYFPFAWIAWKLGGGNK